MAAKRGSQSAQASFIAFDSPRVTCFGYTTRRIEHPDRDTLSIRPSHTWCSNCWNSFHTRVGKWLTNMDRNPYKCRLRIGWSKVRCFGCTTRRRIEYPDRKNIQSRHSRCTSVRSSLDFSHTNQGNPGQRFLAERIARPQPKCKMLCR